MASAIGVAEASLRWLEGAGIVPPIEVAERDLYDARARVWSAARRGGATPSEIRAAFGIPQGGVNKEVEMAQQSTYPSWRTIFLTELDGRPVATDKRRCELLLPHFIRGIGKPVVIPTGSASDFELPAAARDSDWWGGASGSQWFPDECHRFGLLHTRIDVPVDVRTGSAPPRPAGTDETGASRRTLELVAAELRGNPNQSAGAALARILERDTAAYEEHRQRTTRRRGK